MLPALIARVKPKIALSTCWNSSRHTEGYDMLREIAELGFEYAELSHGIRVSLVPGVLNAVRDGVVKIASLHNFCPLPPSINHAAPNLYEPTAKELRERELWLSHTRKTIDFAHQLGAECVVLHGGSVSIFWDRALKKMLRYRTGKTLEQLHSDVYYHMLVERTLNKVRNKSAEPMQRLAQSLSLIIPHAQERGIKLGIENRDGLKELPTDRDYKDLLDYFVETETLYYWHDTGHSKIKEILGIARQLGQLEAMKGRTLGFHLKDARDDGMENLPIGEGELNFEQIATYFEPHHVITLEVAPGLEPSSISSSREKMETLVANVSSTA